MNLKYFANKKILILGFGREGIDNFKFLRKLFSKKVLGVGDKLKISNFKFQISNLLKKNRKIKLHLGENYLKALKDYDVVIKSPGIPPKILKPFLTKKQKVTSQTEIFFENCPGKIIGIAGTKGKSTTATLIYKILKAGKIKTHLVGNIGKPVLNLLFSATPRDIYVYELSSYQLQNLKKSPQIAIFLNSFPDHLDYHKNFQEYLKANQNICRYQKTKDFFIYNPEDKNCRDTAKITKAKKIPIAIKNLKKIIKIEEIPLQGKFNLLNLAAAIEVGNLFEISKKEISRAIKKFKPLPHRLEFVGTFKGIKFYNDSLSVIPETTILAIETLRENLETLILGGFERNLNYKNLAKKILRSEIKTLIFFPTTGQRIWQEILRLKKRAPKLPKAFFVNEMKEAVKLCYQNTERGKITLLSPASASFNLFRDYKERGNAFKKWVKRLGKM